MVLGVPILKHFRVCISIEKNGLTRISRPMYRKSYNVSCVGWWKILLFEKIITAKKGDKNKQSNLDISKTDILGYFLCQRINSGHITYSTFQPETTNISK